MNKEFSKLCTPAKIYFIIAVIASIIMLFNGIGVIAVVVKMFFAFIWTFVLGWLCKKGYTSISWFLVLLPYILLVLAMLNIFRLSREHKDLLNTIQLQGAYGQEHMQNRGNSNGSSSSGSGSNSNNAKKLMMYSSQQNA